MTRAMAEDSARAPCADWVEAQLSRLELLLCSPVEPAQLARFLLHELAPMVQAAQGAAYVLDAGDATQLVLAAGYAAGDGLPARVAIGDGLLGQCAAERRKLVVRGVPASHFRVHSTLGSSVPSTLVFVPVALDAGALAVLELALLGLAEPGFDALLDRLAVRRPLNASEGEASRTTSPPAVAELLEPSAPAAVAAPPRHGFWSTLSHELRSPLNSVIVLSHVLAENADHNLTDKQINLARVIHGSGKDLLTLVDNISLLAKLEAHRLVLSLAPLELGALRRQLASALQPLAVARGVGLAIQLDREVPEALLTDATRVRQVVECMLVAMIERGETDVRLRIGPRGSGWSSDKQRLNNARSVIAFEVDAAPSAERASLLDEPRRATAAIGNVAGSNEVEPGATSLGSLARGGALGLAISRELSALLGGELQLDEARPSFTLYLPASACSPLRSPGDEPAARAASSTVDDGATFRASNVTVARPAVRAAIGSGAPPALEPERRALSTATSLAEDLDGLEILLVDSDVRQAFTLTGQLERLGAAVAHAENLTEVVDRLRARRPPSVVLIDARELGISPEPAVQRLLRLAEQTPFIVLQDADSSVASLPRVHRVSRCADPREVAALLLRVAAGQSSLQTRAR